VAQIRLVAFDEATRRLLLTTLGLSQA